MSGLSLFQIAILLHYYYSPSEHPECGNTPAWRIAVTGLRDAGLLDVRPAISSFGSTYEATEKGAAYAEAIRALPLPVQTWVMP